MRTSVNRLQPTSPNPAVSPSQSPMFRDDAQNCLIARKVWAPVSQNWWDYSAGGGSQEPCCVREVQVAQTAAGLAVWTLGAWAWGPFTTSLKVYHCLSSLCILSVYASRISDSLTVLYPSIFVLCSLHGTYFLPSCLCVQMLTNSFFCSSWTKSHTTFPSLHWGLAMWLGSRQ